MGLVKGEIPMNFQEIKNLSLDNILHRVMVKQVLYNFSFVELVLLRHLELKQ